MPKVKTSLVIIGIIIAMIAASALTVLGLFAAGVIVTEKPELEFIVDAVDAKEYDGTPLKATNFSWKSGADRLKEGHHVEGRILGEQTNRGTSETDLQVKVLDKKGSDVTNEYTIKVTNTELKVVARWITVLVGAQTVPYSGNEIMLENYLVLEGTDEDAFNPDDLAPKELVPGDRIAICFPEFKNVGDKLPPDSEWTPDNFKIYNEKGECVNDNYQLTWARSPGSIEIVPRQIGVKAFSVEKYFDGTPIEVSYQHVWGSLSGDDFIYSVKFVNEDGEEVNPSAIVNVTNEPIKVKMSELVVYRQVGHKIVELEPEEAKNYELVDESDTPFITLTIQRRPIEVQAKDIVKEYDGFALSHTRPGEVLYTVSGLPSQFEIQVTNTEIDDIFDVYDGMYFWNVTVKQGEKNVTDQFEIISRAAIARITPIRISATLKSPEGKITYTGDEITISGSSLTSDDFAAGIDKYKSEHEGMHLDKKNALLALKEVDQHFDVVCADTIKDTGTYTVTLKLKSESAKNFGKAGNVIIEFNSTTITVQRANLTVVYRDQNGTVQTITKTYDGKLVEFDAGNLAVNGKSNLSVASAIFRYVNGDVADYGNHTLVGSYTVAISNVRIMQKADGAEADVTHNYIVSATPIGVTIEKASVSIISRLPVQSVVSSKTPSQIGGDFDEIMLGTIELAGLVEGHTIGEGSFSIVSSASNPAGTIEFYVDIEDLHIYDSTGLDVTDCYDIVGLDDSGETLDPVAIIYVTTLSN